MAVSAMTLDWSTKLLPPSFWLNEYSSRGVPPPIPPVGQPSPLILVRFGMTVASGPPF